MDRETAIVNKSIQQGTTVSRWY